jgi:type IV pilus assembly protein PilV
MNNLVKLKQAGVGLIEVMVTVLILGTSLLAIAAMQSRSLMQNHGAFLATKANILAYNLIDQVRMASTAPIATSPKVIWPAAGAVTAAIVAQIPGATGTLDCTAARLCTVTINWSENTGNVNIANDNVFTYSASL